MVRAVRGKRSQADLSRRAGYRSNVVQRWESGECTPAAAKFLAVCECQRINLGEALVRFYGRAPELLLMEGVAEALLPESSGCTASQLLGMVTSQASGGFRVAY